MIENFQNLKNIQKHSFFDGNNHASKVNGIRRCNDTSNSIFFFLPSPSRSVSPGYKSFCNYCIFCMFFVCRLIGALCDKMS